MQQRPHHRKPVWHDSPLTDPTFKRTGFARPERQRIIEQTLKPLKICLPACVGGARGMRLVQVAGADHTKPFERWQHIAVARHDTTRATR